MLTATNVCRLGARAVADSIVALDHDAANTPLPKLDGSGETDRTGTDDNNVAFPVGNPAHRPRQPLWHWQADMGRYRVRQVVAGPHRLLQGGKVRAGLELV